MLRTKHSNKTDLVNRLRQLGTFDLSNKRNISMSTWLEARPGFKEWVLEVMTLDESNRLSPLERRTLLTNFQLEQVKQKQER
jgi:hypothetical protein